MLQLDFLVKDVYETNQLLTAVLKDHIVVVLLILLVFVLIKVFFETNCFVDREPGEILVLDAVINKRLNSCELCRVFWLQIVDVEDVFPWRMVFFHVFLKRLLGVTIKDMLLDAANEANCVFIFLSFFVFTSELAKSGDDRTCEYWQQNDFDNDWIREVKEQLNEVNLSIFPWYLMRNFIACCSSICLKSIVPNS